MATATFPNTSQFHSVNQDSMPNEFGITNAPHPTNWDEEVVPALKKRLEADRADLDRRISATDFNHARLQSTKPRPIPRRNANDEILQDGLGDDELIPSEWATGSKARFLTANRNNKNAYTIPRSASEHIYAFDSMHEDYHDDHDQYAIPGDTLSPDSPPVQDGTHFGTDMVANARERARKLARERQRAGTEMEMMNADIGRETSQVDENRMRTKSTPGLGERYIQEAGDSRYTVGNANKAPISRSHSPSDGRRTPSSKIPLPISGSMSRVANSPRSVRGKQGTMYSTENMGEGEFGAYNDSPRPDDDQKQPLGDISNHSAQNTPAKKKQKANSVTRRTPNGKRMQNSPPTQDVLDEFGPLGGTPRRTMDTSTGEFGDISRASSNPWDEELLPTVKRRLAQEAMLNDPRLSNVDGLVDAWDRNGIPISTRAISTSSNRTNGIKQATGDQNVGGTNENQNNGNEKILDERERRENPKMEQGLNNHSQEQRMKRLTDQLDLGFKPPHKGQSDEIEMTQINAGQKDRARLDQKKKSKQFSHDPSMPTLTQSQQISQTKGRIENQQNKTTKGDEEGAGCCQCSIM